MKNPFSRLFGGRPPTAAATAAAAVPSPRGGGSRGLARALLNAPPPPPPRPLAPGALGLLFPRGGAALDAEGRIVVKASVLGDRLEVANIVFHAARAPYGLSGCGCSAPTEDADDIRERIFRLLQAARSSDVLAAIRSLPTDARDRLLERLRAYDTADAMRLAADVADAA